MNVNEIYSLTIGRNEQIEREILADRLARRLGDGERGARQMKLTLVSKLAALVFVLCSVLGANAAMGADYDPCFEAYLESGLSSQQMSFDHFRTSYSETLCATENHDLQATRQETK